MENHVESIITDLKLNRTERTRVAQDFKHAVDS